MLLCVVNLDLQGEKLWFKWLTFYEREVGIAEIK